jgi:ACS family tartrate transporter-like MFS transporter
LLDNLAGQKGWQWLFMLEGFPAIVLGALVFFILPDKPDHVDWLSREQKLMLANDLGAATTVPHRENPSLRGAFTAQPKVYGWSFAYFCLMIGLYGLGFWIPTVLASQGIGLKSLGWAAAFPYFAAIFAMVLWSRSSDQRHERRVHLTAAYLAAAGGFLLAAFAAHVAVAIAGFTLAAIGVLAAMPIFWSSSTVELAGPMVAAHIAVINSIGNLGGFFGPVLMGWLRQSTHSYVAGLASIAVCLAVGALTSARLCKPARSGSTRAERSSSHTQG